MIEAEQVCICASPAYENAVRRLIEPPESTLLIREAVRENVVSSAVGKLLCGRVGDVAVVIVADGSVLRDRRFIENVVREDVGVEKLAKGERASVKQAVVRLSALSDHGGIDPVEKTVREDGSRIIEVKLAASKLRVHK